MLLMMFEFDHSMGKGNDCKPFETVKGKKKRSIYVLCDATSIVVDVGKLVDE